MLKQKDCSLHVTDKLNQQHNSRNLPSISVVDLDSVFAGVAKAVYSPQ
jgi:hypothetical protein